MEFTKINDTTYSVTSDSGKTYEITHVPDYDNPEIDLWECSCPGHKYHGGCKHIQQFLEIINEEE